MLALAVRLHARTALLAPFSLRAPPPTETYPLSLHDALPICRDRADVLVHADEFGRKQGGGAERLHRRHGARHLPELEVRSEEHTSELQSPYDLVCRLLLEKKKQQPSTTPYRLQLRQAQCRAY